MNQAGINALFTANQLKGDLNHCLQVLHEISPSSSHSEICSALSSIEDRLSVNKTDAQKIKRSEASEVMEKVGGLINEVENSLRHWRSKYPDTSPIRINNGRILATLLLLSIYSPKVISGRISRSKPRSPCSIIDSI